MTREEAIRALRYERKTALHENKSAFDMAIKSLSAEPCEDCISRQAALDKAAYTETEEGWDGMTVDVKDIESLPPVTPIQKMGRWELVYRDGGVEHYLCNKCRKGRAMIDGDFYRSLMDFKYCPECGSYNGEELSALDGM